MRIKFMETRKLTGDARSASSARRWPLKQSEKMDIAVKNMSMEVILDNTVRKGHECL
jgi:hypothetical protein